MEFEGMLADSVTAEDERNFLVHIDDKGRMVRRDSGHCGRRGVHTALRLCSPVIGNPSMMYYVFEGVGDNGFCRRGRPCGRHYQSG